MTTLHSGGGLLNTLINKLPVELHLPGGYRYCGPGTKLQKRLERGDPGINKLDEACKQHDISYNNNKDLTDRHQADKILQEAAWSRVKSRDASFGERIAAAAVTAAMKLKRKTGMGVKKTPATIRKVAIQHAKRALKHFKNRINQPNGLKEGANVALVAAKMGVRAHGGRKKIKTPRIIPLPKSGGVLPLIPIFAGLSALGSLAGGAAGIAKAVTNAKATKEQLNEATRHNRMMEAVALGKGLYLKPYKQGLGVYLNKKQKQQKNLRQRQNNKKN